MTGTDLTALEVALARVEATIIGRIDDLVRRVDGFERDTNNHEKRIVELEKELYLWKRLATLVGIAFPLILKYVMP